MDVLILGCGYTGRRVAQRLRARGARVIATSRDPARLADLKAVGVEVHAFSVGEPLRAKLPAGLRVLHSIPVLSPPGGPVDPTPELLAGLRGHAVRVVYLSTTGVYGAAGVVDEHTPVAPETDANELRVEAEAAVRSGPWSSLILRPAAIYGPGRGIQEEMRRGRYLLAGDGSNWTSRIHVDDLAALAEAALASDLEGAYPLADDHPARAREVVAFCATLLGCPMPGSADPATLHTTRRTTRKVDGGAILRLLEVPLQYPDYQLGIRASL